MTNGTRPLEAKRARLSKDGERLLCGHGGCGAVVAVVFDVAGVGMLIATPPGWHAAGRGRWAPTQRAQDTYDHDRAQARRNPGTPPGLAADARRRLREGRSYRLRRHAASPVLDFVDDGERATTTIAVDGHYPQVVVGPAALPVRLQCIRCRRDSEIDHKLLATDDRE